MDTPARAAPGAAGLGWRTGITGELAPAARAVGAGRAGALGAPTAARPRIGPAFAGTWLPTWPAFAGSWIRVGPDCARANLPEELVPGRRRSAA